MVIRDNKDHTRVLLYYYTGRGGGLSGKGGMHAQPIAVPHIPRNALVANSFHSFIPC